MGDRQTKREHDTLPHLVDSDTELVPQLFPNTHLPGCLRLPGVSINQALISVKPQFLSLKLLIACLSLHQLLVL